MLQKLKQPRTIAIIVLAIYAAAMTSLFFNKNSVALKKTTEIAILKKDSSYAHARFEEVQKKLQTKEVEYSTLDSMHTEAITSLAWYKNNWNRKYSYNKGADGSLSVNIEEGGSTDAGSMSSSSSTSSTDKTEIKEKIVIVEEKKIVYDTISVTVKKDSTVVKEELVKYAKKLRIHAGIGGTASENLELVPEIKVGATYKPFEWGYIGAEVTKSGVLDYSEGYKVGAYLGFNLDL
jgi:hypothetical protein